MRINPRKYPRLIGIYNALGVQPFYVSKTFWEAAAIEQQKFTDGDTMGDALNDHVANILNGERFILLFSDGAIWFGEFGGFMAVSKGDNIGLTINWDVSSGEGNSIQSAYRHKDFKLGGWTAAHFIASVKFLLAFKRWAETEYKVLPANGKIRDDSSFNGAYKSDFPFKIGLLTANWYRQSVQGHPFPVRRHLHKYLYGKGKKDVKFIMLDIYWKEGIKRGAFKDRN